MSRHKIDQRIRRLEQTLGCRIEVPTYAHQESTKEENRDFIRASAASRGFFHEGNESLAELFARAVARYVLQRTKGPDKSPCIRRQRYRPAMYSEPEEALNQALKSRIEILESRVTPPDWQPLRVVCELIPPDYKLAPGERFVEDDILEGEYQRYPLMLTVHERITSDPNDHGILWSSRRSLMSS